jgi:putative permease
VRADELSRVLLRLVLVIIGAVALIWLLYTVTPIVLLFLLAVIMAMALNAPVMMLVKRNFPRWAAVLVVLLAVILAFAGIGVLVVPRVAEQVGQLAAAAPEYAQRLTERVDEWLAGTPAVPDEFEETSDLLGAAPSPGELVASVGQYTVGVLTGLIFFVILLISIVYILVSPQPLIAGYLGLFPPRLRDQAANALARSSEMVVGWMFSSLVVGLFEGVAAGLFLWWLGVPGALVWAVLAFLAALIPKIGPYLMTVPPILVALAMSPLTALWVIIFFVALNEFTSDTIEPTVRGKYMKLQPLSLLFAVIVLTAAFGIWGALVATPVTGFIKVFYDEFRRPPDQEELSDKIEAVLLRDA